MATTGWRMAVKPSKRVPLQICDDGLGRATKVTDPVGNVTYVVYKDTNYEVRTYAGWNTSTHAPTGPTIVQRFDRPGSYLETITMSATPALDGSNLPTKIKGVRTLFY